MLPFQALLQAQVSLLFLFLIFFFFFFSFFSLFSLFSPPSLSSLLLLPLQAWKNFHFPLPVEGLRFSGLTFGAGGLESVWPRCRLGLYRLAASRQEAF